MKLIWHIIKKDLRHVWPLVACWFALMGLRIGVLFYLMYSASVPVLNQLYLLVACGVVGDTLLIAAIVRMLVQDDVQVGDRGFWMTRPVGWGRLLAAKLSSVMLVCVIGSLVVLVPLWIGLGYDASQTVHCAAIEMAINLGIVLLAFAGAAVTRNAGSFWICTASFAGVIAVSALTIIETQRMGNLLMSRLWLSALLFAGAISVGVVVQYATRRVCRSLVVIVGGAAASLIVIAFWPKEITAFGEVLRKGTALKEGVSAEWSGGVAYLARPVARNGTDMRAGILAGTLLISAPLDAGAVSVRLNNVTWTDENGDSHASLGWLPSRSIVAVKISERGIGQPLKEETNNSRLVGLGPRVGTWVPQGAKQTALPFAFISPWVGDTRIPLGRVTFSGVVEIDYLGKRELTADVLLAAAARDRQGPNRTRVIRAAKGDEELHATVLCAGPDAHQFGNFGVIRAGVPVDIETQSWSQANTRMLGVQVVQLAIRGNFKKKDPAAVGPNHSESCDGESGPAAKPEVRLRSYTRRTLAHATIEQKARVLSIVDKPEESGAAGWYEREQ